MKQNFFAVDLGATSGRTILGSFTEEGISLKEINRFPNHLIEVGGHFYWDIYALYHHIIEGLKLAAQADEPITSIGIDTWGVDFVCLGKDGQLLRQPYAYRDPHTDGAPEAFFSRVSRSEVYAKTGIQVMNFNTLFQLDTLRRHRDSALEACHKILFVPDALSYMLTGEMVTEYTIASTGQLVDAQKRRLDPELLQVVGLTEEHFGRFVYPGEKIGVLTEEVQRITGLGAVPVIAVAGHDTGSAVAAVPAVNPNFAYLSSGTWSLMGVETPHPVINAETEKLNFTNEGGVEGSIRLLKNICGMWLLERCRLNWGNTSYPELIAEANACQAFRSLINPDDPCFANPADMENTMLERCRLNWGNTSYPELIAEANACQAFRSLINPDDPCFANPADMENTIREYARKTGQPVPETRGQVVRCIFESLALRYRQVLENLRSLAPNPIDTLHVIGGGSRNDLLNQFTANAIGIPVIAGPSEATAMGNILMQSIAAGQADSVAAMRQNISKSIPLKRYEPQDAETWAAAYTLFLQITQA